MSIDSLRFGKHRSSVYLSTLSLYLILIQIIVNHSYFIKLYKNYKKINQPKNVMTPPAVQYLSRPPRGQRAPAWYPPFFFFFFGKDSLMTKF